MIIRQIKHKALRRLVESEDAAGLPAASVSKLLAMIAFLQDLTATSELGPAIWKAHQLTGDRRGTWSLFVTRNWRLTFRIDGEPPEITELDLEDYH